MLCQRGAGAGALVASPCTCPCRCQYRVVSDASEARGSAASFPDLLLPGDERVLVPSDERRADAGTP
eukprot:scaffold90054_cov75-Phaeocystis_antarctica.AAC.5